MIDFIDPKYEDIIKIGSYTSIKNNASLLVKLAEKKKFHFDTQTMAFIGSTAICLIPNKIYDWHFDNYTYENRKLVNCRPDRYWTEICYLTEGGPLEIGNWNPDGELSYELDYIAPKPSKILATIYPSPGKSVRYPSFMIHRVINNTTINRWSIVYFHAADMKSNYEEARKRYFND